MNNNKEINPGTASFPETMGLDNSISGDRPNPGVFVMEERKKKQVDFYNKSKDGVSIRIYWNQKNHSKYRNYGDVEYSLSEFRNWLYNQQKFHDLYNTWVDSGYKKDMKPSVDRIDDYKGYSFDNIQLMTWRDNNKKGCEDQKSGKNTKKCRAVLQYGLDGVLISEYHSTQSASRISGVRQSGIWCACNGDYHTSNGYIWKFKDKIND